MKTIDFIKNGKITKEKIIKLLNEIKENPNYFNEYDINTLNPNGSNLLHLAFRYKQNELVDILLENNINVLVKNELGNYPVYYMNNINDYKNFIDKAKLTEQQILENFRLTFNNFNGTLWSWNDKNFEEFLYHHKDKLNNINDDSVTFLMYLNVIGEENYLKIWDKFQKNNDFYFENEDIYLHILNKVTNNKENSYYAHHYTKEESEIIDYLKDYKKEILNITNKFLKNNIKEIKKIKKFHFSKANYLMLAQTDEFEQVDTLFKEVHKIKKSIKNDISHYITHNLFYEDLYFKWKDATEKEIIKKEELKEIAEKNNLIGIYSSGTFHKDFINSLLEELTKEVLKVFPMKDKKIFANNMFLKINNTHDSFDGYLGHCNDKFIINLNVSDYHSGRKNTSTEELNEIKSMFVHEYTHYLQVISEFEFDLNYEQDKNWKKVKEKLLQKEDSHNITNLVNFFTDSFNVVDVIFSNEDKKEIYQYFEDIKNNHENQKEININIYQNKILKLFKNKLDVDGRLHLNFALSLVIDCIKEKEKEKSYQSVYLENLNKRENYESYYEKDYEMHARLNENLLKLKNVHLVRDFNFISDEENKMKKKKLLNNLKKFNTMILNNFEEFKVKNRNKFCM